MVLFDIFYISISSTYILNEIKTYEMMIYSHQIKERL
jgi:hypothetical protein